MAVLVGCRTLLQAFRVHAADRDRACRLAAAPFCTRHYVFSGQVSASRRHGAVTRHYSSDSKDDLRVRYLDGDDAGKFSSATAQILCSFPILVGIVRTQTVVVRQLT